MRLLLSMMIVGALFFSNTAYAQSTCPTLTRTLARGARGADVIALQKFLISQKLLAADSATGFFGALTEAAVKKFQCSQKIVCTGSAASTGHGVVGRLTRAAISRACTLHSSSSPQQTPSSSFGNTAPAPSYTQPNYYSQSTYSASPACTPFAPETRTNACPAGQIGSITQQRTSSCATPSSSLLWTDWITTGNTCRTLSPTSQPSSVSSKHLTPSSGGSAEMTDFMIQDVCVNQDGLPTSGDPSVCANHRDVRFGEFIPYLKTDAPLSNRSVSRSSMSVPVQAPDGTLRTILTFDFGNNTPNDLKWAFRDHDGDGITSFIDGLSIGEVNGATASLIATQDSTTHFSPFWADASCANEDSWILFPVSANTSGTLQTQINISPTCPGSSINWFPNGRSYWTRSPFTYMSGKALDTIRQESVTIDANGKTIGDHIEIAYFTKEYGYTRWESWFVGDGATQTGCNGPDKAERPDLGYGMMHRRFCSDISFTSEVSLPINPLTNPYGRSFVGSRNLLWQGDFAGHTTGGWQQTASPVAHWQLGQDQAGNSFMYVVCGACRDTSPGGIYQEIDTSSITAGTEVRFGAVLRADQAPGRFTVTARFLDRNGLEIGKRETTQTVGGMWQYVGTVANWNFAQSPVHKIRFEVYALDPVRLLVDEAHLNVVR